MDQAISFLAKSGMASKISFNPISKIDVQLPKNYCFIISNSLAESHKYVTASTCYNMRVVECKIAAKVLAKKLHLDHTKISILKDFQIAKQFNFDQCIDSVNQLLKKDPYSRSEIAEILEIKMDELNVLLNRIDLDSFYLYNRSYHVFLESKLVESFFNYCNSLDSLNEDKIAIELGHLMDQSHANCKDNFDCSCPELNQLVEISKKAGSIGSRLTGAGWGGCTVSFAPINKANEIINFIKENYYIARNLEVNDSHCFVTQPGMGAYIFYL